MNAGQTIQVTLKDVYQMLIGECRYGYSRNNHLMPWGAYDKVKRLVPQMYEIDKEYAVYTMKQICEECISDQLMANFYDGHDDEHGNRKEAIKFIEYCLQWIHQHETDKRYEGSIWFPYNYDLFTANLEKDSEPRYKIYEMHGDEKTLLTPEPVSEKDYFNFIFEAIDANEGTYRSERIKVNPDSYSDKRRHYIFHILTPVEKDFYVEHI